MLSLSKLFQSRAEPDVEHRSKMRLNVFFDKHYFPYAQATKRRSNIDLFIFNKHMRKRFGRTRLVDLTNEQLDRWVRAQVEAGYKPATINKHAYLMNRMLNLARHWGYVERNVFEARALRKLPVGDLVQRFLTAEEIAALLRACRQSTHPYLFLFANLLLLTGARKSEARLALWRDVDMHKRVWTVPVSKGGRARRIMLSSAAIEVLHELRGKTEQMGMPTRVSDYLFINPRTRQPYNSFHAAWIKARATVDLQDVRIHDLRHTYASLLINNGASIYEVQKLLGHYHISMTERYAHLLPDTLHDRVEIVSNALKRPSIS